MDHEKLLHEARRRILADAEEAREVMHSELSRVMHSAFKEKLQTIGAASNLLALGNPHFDPIEALEKYLINSSTDNSIPPAMHVHLVKFLSDQKQPPVPEVPCKYESLYDSSSESPIDLSCSSSSSSASSVFSSPSRAYSPQQVDKKFDCRQNLLPSILEQQQQSFISPPARKRKYSMADLDIALEPPVNQSAAFQAAQVKEIRQDESINNFAKENRKENLLTLQRKCLIDGCNLHFGNKNTMHDHMAEVHNVLKFSCHVRNCGISCHTQQQLSNHLMVAHSSMTVFSCSKCGKTFKKYDLMSHHIYAEHAVGLYQCAVERCTFQANIRSQVSRHFEKSHRKYCCSYCNRAFSYTGHLRCHERTHLRVKPFSCTFGKCTYTSENKSHLISHVRIKHFGLPITKKLQVALNIEDDRNPMDYMAVDYELIEQTKNLFKKNNLSFD